MCMMSGNHKLLDFFYFKGHNSAKNYSTKTKFKPDLHVLMTHLYSEFQLKMSMYDKDNEFFFLKFLKSKGHNSAKNYLTATKFKLKG